jgi:Nif-specific regulatory protein
VSLTPSALELLVRHPWPGNVRQLRNMLERMALLTPHSMLDALEVAQALANEMRSSAGDGMAAAKLAVTELPSAPGAAGVRHYRQAQPDDAARIAAALAESRGNKSRAAQALGLTLRQFNYRVSKLRADT